MKTVEKEKLWEEYQKNPSAELREKIIIEYAPLVRVVAGGLACISDITWSMKIWIAMVYLD